MGSVMQSTSKKNIPRCDHSFVDDPWEPGVKRCIYCTRLYEDVMPLKLPPKKKGPQSMNSTLVRALRHYPLFRFSGP